MRIEELQVITQDLNHCTHVEQVKALCEGGVKWIQLRLKKQNNTEAKIIAIQAKRICDEYGATLIINDRVEIAKELKTGVHLGANDMPLSGARRILGNQIIGSTANSMEDVINIHEEGLANYIGLGPFAFTETKENLAPVLDLDVYRHIKRMTNIPVVAIGGIELSDLVQLKETDVHGVAISGAIVTAENITEAAKIWVEAINNLKLVEDEVVENRG